MQVALTDSVFASLDARMEEMAAVKEEREATLGELREVLHSMWDSVGITDEDENRKFFERMLSSPARLHTHTHEKVPSRALQATPNHTLRLRSGCICRARCKCCATRT